MEKIRANDRFLLMLGAVLVCVILFACGAPAPETARTVEPPAERPAPPALASLATPGPPPPSPVPAPETTGLPSSRDAAGPVTFGTPDSDVTGETDDASAREPVRPVLAGPVEGRVFTNKDLDRYRRVKEEFGFKEGQVTVDITQPAAGEKAAGPGDARAADAGDEAREKEDRETREKIAALTAEAEYLRKRIPSLHNPLLPRAAPSEADKVAEAGMDNAQRLDKVNARLAEVESELNGLQRRLAELHQKKSAGPDAPNP